MQNIGRLFREDVSWFWYYLMRVIAILSFTSSANPVYLYWFSDLRKKAAVEYSTAAQWIF